MITRCVFYFGLASEVLMEVFKIVMQPVGIAKHKVDKTSKLHHSPDYNVLITVATSQPQPKWNIASLVDGNHKFQLLINSKILNEIINSVFFSRLFGQIFAEIELFCKPYYFNSSYIRWQW